MLIRIPLIPLRALRPYSTLAQLAAVFAAAYILNSAPTESSQQHAATAESGRSLVTLDSALAKAPEIARHRGVSELYARQVVIDSISQGGFRLVGPTLVDLRRVESILELHGNTPNPHPDDHA